MGTAIDKYRKQFAEASNQYADEESSSSSFIKTQGGVFKIGEDKVPGNELLVVVLDAVHENTYYADSYDGDNVLPPKCFAFGRKDSEMEAHENVPDMDEDVDSYFELQSESGMCADCPMNEWGSASRGKGKACGNRRRLAVIPAGRFIPSKRRGVEPDMEVFEDIDHFKEADIHFLKIPPTSTKNWGKYVKRLQREHQLPPFAVLTHIYIEADEKTQFQIHFDMIEVVEDEDLIDTLFARHEDAKKDIIQAYEEPSDDEVNSSSQESNIDKFRKKKKRR